jgi:heme/copper-type cytochrome/quinol oxidase subunit 2
MDKANKSHIKKGLYIAGALIFLDLLAQKSGLRMPLWFGYVSTLLLVGAVFVSCLLYVRSNGPQKFGDIFAHGFKTTAVVSLIMALYAYLAVKFIYPAPTAEEISAAAQTIQQQGNTMPDEASRMAAEGAGKMWIILVPKEIFVTLVSGMIGALAGAAITKKNQ